MSVRRIALAVVVVCAAAAGVWFYSRPRSAAVVPERAALVEAAGTQRTVEARLTGGFRHGPLRSAAPSIDRDANVRLLAAAGALQREAESDPRAGSLASFGVAQLLLGRHVQAIRELRDAVALAPEDAHARSDLAAARLTSAALNGDAAEDLARAIDAAERALALVPGLPEARFNKALALERAGLAEEAITAWGEYLAVDRMSGWAAEAQERRSRLRAAATRRDECVAMLADDPERLLDSADRCPQQAREHAERLLGKWADATIDGRADEAARVVESVGRVAAALNRIGGERALSDTIALLASAPADRATLARGHRTLEHGRVMYDEDRREDAARAFRDARDQLRRSGSPYWLQAQQLLATIQTHWRELGEASALLEEVETHTAARHYYALQARSVWLRGVVLLQRSDPSAALEQYHKAGQLFERLRETGNVSNVMNAAADTERILGDFARGWQSLTRALRHVESVADPTRRYVLYYNVSLFAQRAGLDFAAQHYQRRALSVAKARRGPVGIVEASINLAGILARIGRPADAETSLAEATGMLALLGDAQPRAYQTAHIAATRGEMLAARDSRQAVDHLDEALAHFTRVEPAQVPRLLLLKGTALAHAGDARGAMNTYAEGIDRFEARLGRVHSDRQRVSYLDEGWELYRKLVELRLAGNQLAEALALSDRGRARAVDARQPPLSIESLRAALAPDQAVVHYIVLDRATHAWVIRDSGSTYHRLDVASQQLAQWAAQVARAMGGRGSAAQLDAALTALHQAIVAPLAIPTHTREIVVVPDGVLRTVPFAALRRADGRYLAQDVAIVTTTAAGTLVARRRPGGTERRIPILLAVGNPVLDRRRWPQLAALPFAGQEAAQSAAMYRHSTLLTGSEATRDRLVARLPDADIFHFAGHAVANEDFPELSRLLLSGSGEDAGELLAQDLAGIGLKPGAIVILSACETAAGPERKAAGPQSIAQAFLALGAGAVVAAQWEVEDVDTSDLMAAFHGSLSRGISPARALQEAQAAQIQRGTPVASWAAFATFSRLLPSRALTP